MEQLLISQAILACPLTASEKKLLAYICQQAVTRSGQCTDSNTELALALAMHTQTVSRLINRLRERKLLEACVVKSRANQRTLTPLDGLLAEYNPNVYSPVSDSPNVYSTPMNVYSKPMENDANVYSKPINVYSPPSTNDPNVYSPPMNVYSTSPDNSSNVYSPAPANDLNVRSPAPAEQPPVADQPRQCVLTGLDISQQVGKEDFVNRQTIRELRQSEPALFKELAAQLLSPEDVALLAGDADALVLRMAARLRRLANLQAEEAALALASFRECPISGADITHQGIHYPFVTAETLNNLIRHDRPAFAQLVSRLGLPDQSDEPLTTQCRTVLWRVRQLASTHVPAYPITYAPGAATKSGSAPSGGRRYCPITGIDITHQQERHRFATAWTIEALYKSNRPGFDQLAGKLLSDSLRQGSPADQCFALSGRIKRLAKAYQ